MDTPLWQRSSGAFSPYGIEPLQSQLARPAPDGNLRGKGAAEGEGEAAATSSLLSSLSTTARTLATGILQDLAMALTDFPSSDIDSIFLSLHAA